MTTNDSACFTNDREISISAVGAALIAIEKELMDLADQDEKLVARRLLIQKKMRICHESIRKLFLECGVSYTPPKKELHWPELHIEQCRLNGIGAEREARMMARVEELERQNAELRIAVEETIEDLKKGFVVCEHCGSQEETSTLDVVDILEDALAAMEKS